MSYRDDRPALRAQADALERELAETRAELERLKSGVLTRVHAPPRSYTSPLWVLALVALVGVTQLLPLPLGVRLGVLLVSFAAVMQGLIVRSLAVIARPSEAIVLAGRARQRVVRGGRALRMPLLETGSRLDLSLLRVPISLPRVRLQDGWASVELVVHARPCPHAPGIERAIERFLGIARAERAELFERLLVPVLQDALSSVSVAELANEREKCAALMTSMAETLVERGLEVIAVYVAEAREQKT